MRSKDLGMIPGVSLEFSGKETLEMFPSLAGAAKDLAERVPCYRIYAHQPCDILELLK